MAVKKKTLDQIAKENKIDISEENAQKVADAYIQPKLDEIAASRQEAAASAQTALKSLENDYFNQYRASMYDAQSRGLTGGLANIDATRLRTQLGQANSEISNALIQRQSALDLERGTALSNAKAYKEQYLKDLRDTVIKLREDDYAQRLAEYQFNQQMAMERAQLAQAAAAANRNYELQEAAQKLQNQAYADEYAKANLSDIYNAYSSMLKQGNRYGAENYLNEQIKHLSELGYNTSSIKSEFDSLETIREYQNFIDKYSGNLTGAKWGLALQGLTSIPMALFSLPFAGVQAGVTGSQIFDPNSNYNKLKGMLDTAKSERNKAYMPSWYTGTSDNWYKNYLKAIGAVN